MTRKYRYLQRLAVVAVLGVAECAALGVALIGQAQAQDFPFLTRQRAPRGDGFFQQLFGNSNRRQDDREYQQQQAPADNSRAPAARKDSKADQVAPTTSVVVLGDGMADWLAYGLEDAFADAPEVGIVRKNKQHSGLVRYDARSDLDWWHVARDLLAPEKPNYVIMMLGVADRQNMREKDVAKEAEKKDADKKADGKDAANKDAANKDAANKDAANKDGANKDKPAADQNAANKEQDDDELPQIAAPEPAAGRKGGGNLEFRGDAWEKIYTRRIDETVAALKSKGVPVFWVGLPSIRGTKSTADAVYLNDLFRARAEKAGAVYIDVWAGFLPAPGKYTNFGPDYEGQMRRLRSGDGVYFTKYGARKLAHYVERELRRYMSNRGPVALPSGPMGPVPADGKPAARPLAGPVVPLTMTSGNSDELLGGPSAAAARADATAAGVLVKGDAVAAPSGRADDFWWPRGSPPPAPVAPPVAATTQPSASLPAASASIAAPAVAKPEALKPEAVKPEPAIANPEPARPAPATEPRAKPAQPAQARPAPPQQRPVEARPRADNAPRPPQPVQQPVRRRDDGPFGANGPFGWIR